MDDSGIDWDKVDWVDISRRLRGRLRFIAGCVPDVFNCGVSVDDVLQETFEAFFASPDMLGWKAEKGSLLTFLGGVAYHKMGDHIRRNRKIAISIWGCPLG